MKHAALSLLIWLAVALLTILVWLASLVSVLLFGLWDHDRVIPHACVIAWARSLVKLNPYWKLTIDDQAGLMPGRPYVFVANHQSFADVVVLPHVGVPYKCLSKAELFRVPFLGWTLSLSRHIPLRRGSVHGIHQAMDEARRWIKRGMPVAFFAEGTRSRTGNLTPFKSGAFKLAIETQTPVVPLVITGTREALPHGTWKFRHKVHGRLTILPSIDSAAYRVDKSEALKQCAFDAIARVFHAQQASSS